MTAPGLIGHGSAAPTALSTARNTVMVEREALSALADALGEPTLADAVEAAVTLLVGATGRIVVTGIGKSGLVARKIAATMTSTGAPALYLHPADAGHGDLGTITGQDAVLALSWSGETTELTDIVNYCRRFAIPLVAMTAMHGSSLARRADVALILPAVVEACPNRLAPTSSTIVQASLGDALAMALLDARGFTPSEFRTFHPRGKLGAQLRTVGDVMSTGTAVPTVRCDATIVAAIAEMSSKRFGISAVVDDRQQLIGAFTDGDLRRSLTAGTLESPVRDHMTCSPLYVEAERMLADALTMMNSCKVAQLFVCTDNVLVGIVHLHDILRAEVV